MQPSDKFCIVGTINIFYCWYLDTCFGNMWSSLGYSFFYMKIISETEDCNELSVTILTPEKKIYRKK